ncbi:MAG: 2-C-methyl-D-erythritol 4-phosphate cytidylyltransferase [Lachnospiraceae bacterium]|nr:2-C-methyl-D-erythritol 4-phosphate cytidylyltransferase [Lachnospiraceae bacterium]
MNIAIILAGGVGSRMKTMDRPKQYIEVKGRPIISYCLQTFQEHKNIQEIYIVADESWQDYISGWIAKEHISKFRGFAPAGKSRQHSIYNGLVACEKSIRQPEDIVILHDAARPFVTREIIDACILGATELDGAMPVITIKDTVYRSTDGKSIASLLERSELFAGQAPESFRYGKYRKIHDEASDEELMNTRGSSEIAYKHGMEIRLFEGAERNFKITTMEDLTNFEAELNKEGI